MELSFPTTLQLIFVKDKFSSAKHPQPNRQEEYANKVILNGLKKRLDNTKGLWAEEVNQVLWSYHTTPHSYIEETPFKLTFGSDTMKSVEVKEPTLRRLNVYSDSKDEMLSLGLEV